MYQQDVNIDHTMKEYSISATAARALFHINRYIFASRRAGIRDARGVAYCYASREALADAIGKSTRTADRAIAELKAAGLITLYRTKHNGRIYLNAFSMDSATCGVSGTATNGVSNISSKSISPIDTSIYQHKTQQEAPQMTCSASVDAERPLPVERIAPATDEKMQDKPQEDSKKGFTPKKGKPTPKRPRRTKAEREAARAEYKRLLERKLDMANPYWLIPETADEYRNTESLIDLIADAMSAEGRQIRVNGAGLTSAQYWYVVQNISNEAISGLFDRLSTAEATGGIANKRAYTLASVYNAVQWHELTRGAVVSAEALYRRMA